MPTITGPILDSSGQPASGLLRVVASYPFEIATGLVTQARAVVEVRDGVPLVSNEPWAVPVTPTGIELIIEQDLDGDTVTKHNVVVPNLDAMTYAQLLFNRGTGAGGPAPYWWIGLSTDPIPAGALAGDVYIYTDTGAWGVFAWE